MVLHRSLGKQGRRWAPDEKVSFISEIFSLYHPVLILALLAMVCNLPFRTESTSGRDDTNCKWIFQSAGRGYPSVAVPEAFADYVCPSMFRDMSDYVFSWPYNHFSENVSIQSPDSMTELLPPVCMLNLLVVGMFTLNTWLHAYVSQA